MSAILDIHTASDISHPCCLQVCMGGNLCLCGTSHLFSLSPATLDSSAYYNSSPVAQNASSGRLVLGWQFFLCGLILYEISVLFSLWHIWSLQLITCNIWQLSSLQFVTVACQRIPCLRGAGFCFSANFCSEVQVHPIQFSWLTPQMVKKAGGFWSMLINCFTL